jgi:hypothetical protein
LRNAMMRLAASFVATFVYRVPAQLRARRPCAPRPVCNRFVEVRLTAPSKPPPRPQPPPDPGTRQSVSFELTAVGARARLAGVFIGRIPSP